MSEESRDSAAVVQKMMRTDGFSAWLGVEMLESSTGFCRLRMKVRHEMLNGFGVGHGGIAYSLADSALAFASNGHGTVTMSIHNSISYPAPVHEGDILTAVAEEESVSNRVGFYRVNVTNQNGTAVALFRGTVYRTAKSHFD